MDWLIDQQCAADEEAIITFSRPMSEEDRAALTASLRNQRGAVMFFDMATGQLTEVPLRMPQGDLITWEFEQPTGKHCWQREGF